MPNNNIIVKPSVLKTEQVTVAIEGDLVVFKLGNREPIKFHYESALQVSQMIRLKAKEAKQKAGDVSRHWSALANLEGLK